MNFDYYYGSECEQFAFYRIPKILFTDDAFTEISVEAKTLYGILLDRMQLSARNSWMDDRGRVYIVFTIEQIQEAMGCGNKKAIKLLDELEKEAHLIERKRCEEGYDYSIMDEKFCEIDGGVYDNPDVDIRYALLDIVDDLTSHPDTNGEMGNISSDAKWEQLDFDEVSEQMNIANLPGPEVFMSRVVMEFKAKTEECFRKIGNMSATDIEEHIAEYVMLSFMKMILMRR